MKTTNKKCRQFVQAKTDFQGHNLFGITENGKFVVYSYGRHFPLFAFINGIWYSNSDKYSMSTSKQYGQAHPLCDTVSISTTELKKLIEA